MKIDATFAAVECRVFRRVNENLQTVFELTAWVEVNESIVARVKTADEARDAASRPSKAKIHGAVDFHVEIGIADDELKCRVVGTAREKFFRRRRASRISKVECELPVLGEIVNRAGGAADG